MKRTILFFIILVAIVSGGLLFKTKYLNRPKFTPEELLSLMDNFSVNKVAGICNEKKFIGFDTAMYYNITSYTHRYDLFYTGNSDNSEEECVEKQKEHLALLGNEKYISYIVKQPDYYQSFLNYITKELNASKYTGILHPYYKSCAHYLVNSVVVIDCGFDMKNKIYQIVFSTPDEIKRITKERVDDSIFIEQKQTETIAAGKAKSKQFTSEFLKNANATIVTDHPNSFDSYYANDNTITSLRNGTRVKVIDENDQYGRFQCDYISEDCIIASAWFLKTAVSKDVQ